jgi:hypothetical protein
MSRKPYKEKSFEHKVLLWGVLIFLSIFIIQFFVTHRFGKTDIDNYETPRVFKESEYVYDSLFSNCNYIEFWNHTFWNDTHPDITNTNTILFWYKYRGAYTTTSVNLRNRPSVKKSNILKVYPNPSYDFITVEYRTGDKYNKLWIEIKDATGKSVLSKTLEGGNNEELVNTSALSPNVYTLLLYGDGELLEIVKITVLE